MYIYIYVYLHTYIHTLICIYIFYTGPAAGARPHSILRAAAEYCHAPVHSLEYPCKIQIYLYIYTHTHKYMCTYINIYMYI